MPAHAVAVLVESEPASTDAVPAASPALKTSSKAQASKPADSFVDQGAEYANFAARTQEKIRNGNWIAGHAAPIAQNFIETAKPGETLNTYEFGGGDLETTARVVEEVHNVSSDIAVSTTVREFSGAHTIKALDRTADILAKQKNFAFAITNLPAANAPTLKLQESKPDAPAKPIKYLPVELDGSTAEEFRAQFAPLQEFIDDAWQTKPGQKDAAVPAYQAVLVVSRKDRDAALDPVPQINQDRQYDVASAVHAWRLASDDKKKAGILAPAAAALKPETGRLFAVQASGDNTGGDIVEEAMGQSPFKGWDSIIKETQTALTSAKDSFIFHEENEGIKLHASRLKPQEALRLAVYAGQVSATRASAISADPEAMRNVEKILVRNRGHVTFENRALTISRHPEQHPG
jgi:hypothetical protein